MTRRNEGPVAVSQWGSSGLSISNNGSRVSSALCAQRRVGVELAGIEKEGPWPVEPPERFDETSVEVAPSRSHQCRDTGTMKCAGDRVGDIKSPWIGKPPMRWDRIAAPASVSTSVESPSPYRG